MLPPQSFQAPALCRKPISDANERGVRVKLASFDTTVTASAARLKRHHVSAISWLRQPRLPLLRELCDRVSDQVWGGTAEGLGSSFIDARSKCIRRCRIKAAVLLREA